MLFGSVLGFLCARSYLLIKKQKKSYRIKKSTNNSLKRARAREREKEKTHNLAFNLLFFLFFNDRAKVLVLILIKNG